MPGRRWARLTARPAIRVAVVGCGHMGAHHARAIAAAPETALVGVVDIVMERAERLGAQLDAPALPAVPDGTDLVVVATPTTTHVQVAGPQLAAGRWCLIEKPLAPTAAAARALVHPRALVGHIERFNPSWSPPSQDWRALTIVRRAAPTGRATDVDALADLLVHDVDLLRSLGLPSPAVRAIEVQRCSSGSIEQAEIALAWDDGRTATLSVSRRARAAERSWVVDAPSGRVVMDLSHRAPQGDDALYRQLRASVCAIRGEGCGAPRALRAADGVGALEWVDAVRRRADGPSAAMRGARLGLGL